MPFDGFDEALQELPDDGHVTITASPQLGIEATIEKSIVAATRGFNATPHLAARYVRDETHLRNIATRLTEAGVTSLFVPAGDLETPKGPYASAHDLLVALDAFNVQFEEIGITGYPEGHPFLDEGTLNEAMQKKAPFATYIVTQLCFDPKKILDWIRNVRRQRAVNLPIEVGIPGVLKHKHLLRIARRVGVGNSIRFLQKTAGVLEFGRQLFGSWSKYTPDALIEGIAPYAEDSVLNLRGLHIYTFNQVRDTEEWRSERLLGQ